MLAPTFSLLGPPLERDPLYSTWLLAPELPSPPRPNDDPIPGFSRVTRTEARRALYFNTPPLEVAGFTLLGWHHARPTRALTYHYVSNWRYDGPTTGRRGSIAMEVFRELDPATNTISPREGARWRVRLHPAMRFTGGVDGISRTTVEDAQRAAFRCLLELLVHRSLLPREQALGLSLVPYPELPEAAPSPSSPSPAPHAP